LADDGEFFFEAGVASFAWAVVRRVWGESAPGNGVFDVVVFGGPDVLAEFGRVSVFSVAEAEDGWRRRFSRIIPPR